MGALKFRVLLDSEKEQEVFRDIVISESEHFETFYRTILAAFNFEGKEIGSFFMSNDDWDKGQEISLMDMSYSDDDLEVSRVMSQTTLSDMMEDEHQKIILVYDFFRMWIFLIELVEKTNEVVSKPKVVFSAGTAPPEDSKLVQEDDEYYLDNEEDEFDEFDSDFEDGYDEDDYSSYDDSKY